MKTVGLLLHCFTVVANAAVSVANMEAGKPVPAVAWAVVTALWLFAAIDLAKGGGK